MSTFIQCPRRQALKPTSRTSAPPQQSQPKSTQTKGGRSTAKPQKRAVDKGKGKAVDSEGFQIVEERGRPKAKSPLGQQSWADETATAMDLDPVASGSNTKHNRSSSL
jgi:hypothetical protein